ncbi:MAG: NAD(P)/FAD-dependent oxidoreductase [Aeromicrobium erythreum]
MTAPHHDPVDESTVRAALDQANLNVLRIALLQVTGDESLARMRVDKVPMRGGAFFAYVLNEAHHQEVKDKAVAYLSSFDGQVPPPPGEDEARRLMELLTGDPLSDSEFRFGLEEVAFADFPREARWSAEAAPDVPEGFEVVIVGAGASGIVAAIQLERLGIPYRVIERQDDLGGTWHLNHYPDARVDTNSYLYQFKFEKNYPWTEYFASQAEVQAYLRHVAVKHGVIDKIEYGVELRTARYDEGSAVWDLDLVDTDGATRTLRANVVVSAAGLFSTPKIPDIEGIEEFEGRIFHTTGWDDGYDYRGKRLALIGNGSTGTQLMPRLAKDAAHMTVYQRTPQWVSKMEGYREQVPEGVRWLFDHVPYYWNWYCYSSQMTTSGMQGAQVYDREWQRNGGQISERNDGLRQALVEYIDSKVGHDPDLVAKVTPDYAPLARRLVVDNGWYDALLLDHVDLVTSGIDRITPHGIVDNDGVETPVDAIALAAGFEVARYMWPVDYVGRDGATLEEVWEEDGARAYLGVTMPKFPNLFVFYGPNAQPRAGGFLSWIEIWSRYVTRAIVLMLEQGHRSMEVRQEVFEDYNRRLDEAMKDLIWENEGPKTTTNYYVNKHGRQNVQMPWLLHEYHQWVVEPAPSDYHLEP